MRINAHVPCGAGEKLEIISKAYLSLWLNQKDRRAVINYGYEAFKDLAMILGIEDKDISLGGRLSIAFGARGSGSALAHYEPLYEVINLTKLRGAGSLAHEWGHALDYILGEKLYGGKLISSHNQMGNGMIKAMKFNPNGTISQFYSEAKKLDSCYAKSDKGYWSSETEMFARCFACYVFDKLKEKGYRNDYLCGHAYMTNGVDINGNIIHGYPTGEDKKRIFSEIDLILDTLKEKGLLIQRTEKEAEEENVMENIPFITSFQQLTLQF